eukprot:CAMPEP_0176377110 /NCGR_PEP_ID=MMETSP0126-20121128/28657_1 /TAXON_ID=141414 ORGANISM="Strombidinopsis acuminatum, Strain SPMC142" /NCGR_SAMPLE_ID=MMETSP0126 /ASSEMBLY_ACC=CAM_ASM_000229 /LENGTH=111 /DNA_ID=CAMNT_0017738813 /DNA_START=23 /DNA_END=358 /DNA_ORIENTATION=+
MADKFDEPLLNYKPTGLQFVEANKALLECYQLVDLEAYNKMSQGQQDQVCIEPKKALRGLLSKNQLTMTETIKDRVEMWKSFNKTGYKRVHESVPEDYFRKTPVHEWDEQK